MTLPITASYAALCGLLLVWLTIRTIQRRYAVGVAIGDGGDEALVQRIRVHANLIEFAPLALLLIYFVERTGFARWVIHGLGGALVVGRFAHAYGFGTSTGPSFARAAGVVLTLLTIIGAAALLLWTAIA